MKYTKPMVKVTETADIQPRTVCNNGYSCGEDGDKFTCSKVVFTCKKSVTCTNFN